MISYTQYLTESKEGKNVHLEHIEDEVLNGGVNGTRAAINFLRALRDMMAGHTTTPRVNITTKWDGAPAIFAGINPENNKFFVGTKGVFAKNAKLNYTNADIDRNHPGEGLNQKLKLALKYLPDLGITGVIQGDMMFTHTDLKYENIDGDSYVTFQPNTVVYAVPADSNLAKQITTARLGVVWHTTYIGRSLEDMRASFNVDISRLRSSKNVWFRDASFVDASGTATFTQKETDDLTDILSQVGNLFRTISARTINEIASSETYNTQIKAWNNLKVREGQKISNTAAHVKGLILHIEEKLNARVLEAKKQDTKMNRLKEKSMVLSWYRVNRNELKKIFDLQNLLNDAKLMIVRKLELVKSNIGTYLRTDSEGLRVTAPEGFVAVDILKGNAVKLVDRLEFAHANFTAQKEWSK
jgi:hypothetical protein